MQPSVGEHCLSTAFSTHGEYFAAAGQDGLTLWRVVRGAGKQASTRTISFEPIRRLTEDFSSSLCFSHDGNWLAWADGAWGMDTHSVHVWDLRSLQPHALSMAKSSQVMKALSFSGDSNHLTFVDDKLAIAVWDVTTRQQLASFGNLRDRGLERPKAHLSHDGVWCAVADQTITIWDMEARKLLVALSPEASVCSVGWSPDRKLLAVGGTNGALEIWDLPKVNANLTEMGLGW
jgi:WD40 repeat protein